MNMNVGGADRVVRIIAGLIIIGIGFYFKSWWGAIGAIPLITGLIGWCPAYSPFRISTAKKGGQAQ